MAMVNWCGAAGMGAWAMGVWRGGGGTELVAGE